jgi:hypothetical protein
MGPKMNARQQRHVGALGNTLGDTGEGIERRRPMLTRQNRKGNVERAVPKFPPNLAPITLCFSLAIGSFPSCRQAT